MPVFFVQETLIQYITEQKQSYIEQIAMPGQTNGAFRIGNYLVDHSQVLGKGATGYVYKGTHADTLEPVAVKAIDMRQVNNEVTQYLLEGEKKAMTTIHNSFVVKTHDVIQHKDFCYIVMEQCPRGTLKDYISQKGCLSSEETIEIFRKILIGYAAIVESLFIHRDLKTANILLRTNNDPVIIDFGYCQMIMGKKPMIQYNVGSPSYMSPQAYNKNRYSEKSDIWALGVILYEMLTGKTPEAGLDIKQFFRRADQEGRIHLNTNGMNQVSKQLLNLSLQISPQSRGTIHKLKYLIDKALIPKMKVQLKKTQSLMNGKPEGEDSSIRKQANFNFYSPRVSCQNIHHNSFRNPPVLNAESQKFISMTPKSQIKICYQPNRERNQKSLINVPNANKFTVNGHQPHHVLRKSIEKNQNKPIPFRKVVSFNGGESNSIFKSPTLTHKAVSQGHFFAPSSHRII